MNILQSIQSLKANGKKGFAMLIDPDKIEQQDCNAIAAQAEAAGVSLLFAGGSLMMQDRTREVIKGIKSNTNIPVVLFPGNLLQVKTEADGILFLSLISGRNADLLIGNHVIAAPMLKQSSLEVLATGYMLIDTGKRTAVHYMSGTNPIPYEKHDIAAATATAGEMLGLKLIYMDGGSGADQTISPVMVSKVANAIDIPLLVGGGIRSAADAENLLEAGADMVVVGNALENPNNAALIHEISSAVASF